MFKKIVTKESVWKNPEYVEKEWSYNDIFETWDHDDETCLVPVLANRCIEYEREIEQLRVALDEYSGISIQWCAVCGKKCVVIQNNVVCSCLMGGVVLGETTKAAGGG